MDRRRDIGLWTVLVAVATAAGIAVAGPPQLGADAEPVEVTAPSGEETSVPTTSPPAETAPAETTPAETTTSTVPAPELRPNEEVTVLVVNGTTVAGAAGRLTEQLAGEGHPTLTPTSTTAFPASEIWFTGDFGPEAADLAERLGIFPENVTVMPDDAGVTVGSAAVVVVLGPDLAGGT